MANLANLAVKSFTGFTTTYLKPAITEENMDSPIEIKENYILLHVKLSPKSRNNQILGVHANALKIQITQPPEKGKANKALITMIAKKLRISKSSIEIISGLTSQNKVLKLPKDTDLSAIINIPDM